MVEWGCWKMDIKVTEREKGMNILRRQRGHPDHVAWDEVGKRILRILDRRVRGEIFSDVSREVAPEREMEREDRRRLPRPKTPQGLPVFLR